MKGIEPMAKLEAAVREVVERSEGRERELVDVIVSLDRPADPPERGAPPLGAVADEALRFEAEARPLIDRMNAIGAAEVHPLWIARAVAAKLPVSAVLEIAREKRVRRIALNTKRKVIL